jgi:transposase
VHRLLLRQHLNHLQLIDRQIEELSQQTALLLQASSQAIVRLVDIPGIGTVTAQQIVAEAGPQASAFPSAAQFSSWIGVSPGKDESAEQNNSGRCAKGNRYLRVTLCQAAQAAVRAKQSVFEQKFRRLLPRMGYTKAIWAIAHHLAIVIWKVLHQGVEYVEYGMTQSPEAIKRRLQRIKKQLRELGYSDELQIIQTQHQTI